MAPCGGVRPCHGCARIARPGPRARATPVSGCSEATPADPYITRQGPLGRNSTRHGSSRVPNGVRRSCSSIGRQRLTGAAHSASRVVQYSAATSPAPTGRRRVRGRCRSSRGTSSALRPDRDEADRHAAPYGARRRAAGEGPAASVAVSGRRRRASASQQGHWVDMCSPPTESARTRMCGPQRVEGWACTGVTRSPATNLPGSLPAARTRAARVQDRALEVPRGSERTARSTGSIEDRERRSIRLM